MQIKKETDGFKEHYTLDHNMEEEIKRTLKIHIQTGIFHYQTTPHQEIKQRKSRDKQTTKPMKNGYGTCPNAPSPKQKKRVLARGLHFTITPSKIPHEQYILATELACHKCQDQGQNAELRNAISGILKSAKLPPSNITQEEQNAIKSLKGDKTITILPADK